MKNRHVRNFTFFLLASFFLACASKKESDQETGSGQWKEMDEFHMVMAETFHPYKDSANLEPAKSRAGELASVAEKWTQAPLPKKVDNDEMEGKLRELKDETAALVRAVGSEDDHAIGEQLTKVHDIFHSIQEDWYNDEQGHSEGHQH